MIFPIAPSYLTRKRFTQIVAPVYNLSGLVGAAGVGTGLFFDVSRISSTQIQVINRSVWSGGTVSVDVQSTSYSLSWVGAINNPSTVYNFVVRSSVDPITVSITYCGSVILTDVFFVPNVYNMSGLIGWSGEGSGVYFDVTRTSPTTIKIVNNTIGTNGSATVNINGVSFPIIEWVTEVDRPGFESFYTIPSTPNPISVGIQYCGSISV